MSLSGVQIIEKVKFTVSTDRVYLVDKVTVKAKPEGKIYKMADRSYKTKIAGYHLEMIIEAQDVQQTSGTAKDFISLQADIEDPATTVDFYPDATQAEHYEVTNTNLNARTIYETDFNTRIDSDYIICNTVDIISKSDLLWYKKF